MTTLQPKTMEDVEEQLKIDEKKTRRAYEITKKELSNEEDAIKSQITYRRRILVDELNKRNEIIEKYPCLKDFDSVKIEISDDPDNSPDNSVESRRKRFGAMPLIEDKIEYEIITAVRKIVPQDNIKPHVIHLKRIEE